MATNNQALWFPSLGDCAERTALIDGETEISYRELGAYSERLRGGLLNGEASLDGEDVEAVRVKDYRWVPVDQFADYPFPPADRHTMDDFQLFVSRGKARKPPMA